MKRAFLLLCAALLLLTGCSTPPAEASGTSETSSAESEPPTDENEYTKKAKEAAQAVYPQLKSYTPYDYSLDLSAVNLIDDGAGTGGDGRAPRAARRARHPHRSRARA